MNVPQWRALNWGRIAAIVAAVAALAGVGIGAAALSAPVQRAGNPTIAVPAPTGTRFTSPFPSPSASDAPSGSASASASASGKPTKPVKSSGDFDWSKATATASGSAGKLYRYAVAVESTARLKADAVAGTVAGVLNDPRSWTGSGDVRFALVPADEADVRVYLAGTGTATKLCGSATEAGYTCVRGGTVVINAAQWRTAPAGFAGDLGRYRAFLVNHAFGHLIGEKHRSCPGEGKAPVMLQQGAGLDGCTANPWP